MKYYKNLIERKKYSVIIISICTVLAGIFVCYLSVKDVFDRGLALSKTWYLNDGYGIISVMAASNMGMVLCGVLLAYIGFWPTKLFFRDKNKKFITVTRGYQIYNYVVYYKVPKEVCGYR